MPLRTRATLAVAALALLAGCTLPDEAATTSGTGATTATGGGGVRVDATTYTITLTEFNGQSSPHLTQAEDFTLPRVRNGTDFTFTMRVEGSPVTRSEHIGGHFGANSTDQPSPTVYTIECDHVGGNLPQAYTVTCHARRGTEPLAPGTYHLRGHARITQDGENISWWSPEFRFVVT